MLRYCYVLLDFCTYVMLRYCYVLLDFCTYVMLRYCYVLLDFCTYVMLRYCYVPLDFYVKAATSRYATATWRGLMAAGTWTRMSTSDTPSEAIYQTCFVLG
eukprot:s881_g17.t1